MIAYTAFVVLVLLAVRDAQGQGQRMPQGQQGMGQGQPGMDQGHPGMGQGQGQDQNRNYMPGVGYYPSRYPGGYYPGQSYYPGQNYYQGGGYYPGGGYYSGYNLGYPFLARSGQGPSIAKV